MLPILVWLPLTLTGYGAAMLLDGKWYTLGTELVDTMDTWTFKGLVWLAVALASSRWLLRHRGDTLTLLDLSQRELQLVRRCWGRTRVNHIALADLQLRRERIVLAARAEGVDTLRLTLDLPSPNHPARPAWRPIVLFEAQRPLGNTPQATEHWHTQWQQCSEIAYGWSQRLGLPCHDLAGPTPP